MQAIDVAVSVHFYVFVRHGYFIHICFKLRVSVFSDLCLTLFNGVLKCVHTLYKLFYDWLHIFVERIPQNLRTAKPTKNKQIKIEKK